MSPPKNSKILLIEDDDNHAEIFTFYAQEIIPEIQLERMRDGEEAIRFFSENRTPSRAFPCLIILDLNLPKFSGHEVLREIKSHPVARRIPVVILSCSHATRDVYSAYDTGANSYIRKPLEAGQFKPVVLDILNYWKRNECAESIYLS